MSPYVGEDGLPENVSWVAADFFTMTSEEAGLPPAGQGLPSDGQGLMALGPDLLPPPAGKGFPPDADLFVMTRILHDW